MFISHGILYAYVIYARLFRGALYTLMQFMHVLFLYTFDAYFTCDMYFVFYYALSREYDSLVHFCIVYTCAIGRIRALG